MHWFYVSFFSTFLQKKSPSKILSYYKCKVDSWFCKNLRHYRRRKIKKKNKNQKHPDSTLWASSIICLFKWREIMVCKGLRDRLLSLVLCLPNPASHHPHVTLLMCCNLLSHCNFWLFLFFFLSPRMLQKTTCVWVVSFQLRKHLKMRLHFTDTSGCPPTSLSNLFSNWKHMRIFAL